MTVKVYVEGGGDHNKALQTQCRRGFSEFVRKAGLEGRMPRIVACGGRKQAFDAFCAALEGGQATPLLLIDSEEPVTATSAWEHVRTRTGDGWQRPQAASNDQIHLMVQAMEAWFYAARDKLQAYYGAEFRAGALSQRNDVEGIPKADLFSGLERASRGTAKGEYSKGDHSFRILELLDPATVRAASPHAARFLDVLNRICAP